MASASLKITLRDGTTESFSEQIGNGEVDYTEMDKALHRLQEQSNSFLTVQVEKEKELSAVSHKNGSEVADGEGDEEEESSDDEDEDESSRPPEKKPKL